jgi:predicted RNA-binding protein with PUA-like domain
MLNIVTLLTTLVAGPLACTLDTNGLAKPAPYAINHNLNVKLPAYIFVYIDAIMAKHYWLLKTEPSTFSIQDLEKAPKKTTFWEGVRNYQARNFLRDDIKVGDNVFIYHSNTEEPGIMGTAKVVKNGYPDESQYNTKSKYYDSASTSEKPRWYVVDIQHQQTFKHPVFLKNLRATSTLTQMVLLQKGSRLSVQPVSEGEWKTILKMAQA